jgi:hypothetical protein
MDNKNNSKLADVISIATIVYLVWMGLGDASRRILKAKAKYQAQRMNQDVQRIAEPAWKSELRNHAEDNRNIPGVS